MGREGVGGGGGREEYDEVVFRGSGGDARS